MFENVRGDLQQACKVNLGKNSRFKMLQVLLKPSTYPVISFRFGTWARTVRIPVVRQILIVIAVVARFFIENITGVVLTPGAQIGPGLVVHTWHGVFVGPVKIGKNCIIQHGVVIGWNTREVGNNVFFGPGAKVMGTPKIGNNVVVIANSLVMTDVPDDTTVVGVPARIKLPRGGSLRYRNSASGKKPEEQAKKPPVPEPILKN
jgi:serine O-acetyltransferase